VRVRRDPASLEMEVFMSPDDSLDFACTDRFAIDVNDRVPAPHRRTFPAQYHLSWTAPPAAGRRFIAVIALNGARADTGWSYGVQFCQSPLAYTYINT